MAPGLRLPDSVENTVIAPDLSNLPPGATALDVRTGEEITPEPGQRYVEENEAEQEARERGYRRISLRTRALYVEAVRLYERAGWTRGPDQPPPGPDRLYYRDL